MVTSPAAPHVARAKPFEQLLALGLICAALVVVSTQNFLLFHSVTELFAIVIGTSLFFIAWNTRSVASDDFLLFIGVGYLAIDVIDLLHVLAFPGVNVIGSGRGLSSQLWLSARFIEALTFIVAPLLLGRRISRRYLFGGFAIAAAVPLALIYAGFFPQTVAGPELTPFKSVSEVVIAALFGVAMYLLWLRREEVDATVLRLIVASLALRIASELSLVVYHDPYGIANLVGHLLKLGATYLLYKALVENLLMRPYETLFRSLKEHEEQLRAAVKELETFSYSVSHDLRAHLTAVIGFGELLADAYGDRLDDAGRDYIAHVVRGGTRMAEVIDDLLRLGRLSRSDIEPAPVDVTSLCSDVVLELRKKDPTREVEVSIAPDLRARADARLLRSAIENLVGNAWKFTSKATDARIEIGRKGESGDALTFYVRDNGAGFDPTKAEALFTPYARLHTQKEFAGHGIGLATVQRIVQRHGGEVWAEGEVGKGATFYVKLPAGGESRTKGGDRGQ